MATDVVMPQMGESIAEGTIVRWIKKVGDKVDRDEPLFEISTDKVDAEIPSPAGGVVSEIRVKEGETVAINTVVAVIGDAGARPAAASEGTAGAGGEGGRAAEGVAASGWRLRPRAAAALSRSRRALARSATDAERCFRAASPSGRARPGAACGVGGTGAGDERRYRGATHGDRGRDPRTVVAAGAQDREGAQRRHRADPRHRDRRTRHQGRHPGLHRQEGARQQGRKAGSKAAAGGKAGSSPLPHRLRPRGARAVSVSGAPPVAQVTFKPGENDLVEKMSVMRKRISEHMVQSVKTSAHVHSVFEVNFGRIAKIREAKKAEFERAGAKLTYMSFIIKAAIDALRAVPIVNASVDGDNIVYHKDINVGIAVALDWGLIVPVIKKADEKNLVGLSRSVADLANRARGKQLKPDEVAGGTFTITNPGVFGALFGMPIISQPQVAILGIGNVEKRPVVVDDAIAIRPMCYLTLGYDHRVIDGAVADEFMSIVKKSLENWDPNAV